MSKPRQQKEITVSAELLEYGAFTYAFDPNTMLCFMISATESPSVIQIQYKRVSSYRWDYIVENGMFSINESDHGILSFLEHSYQKLIGAMILGITD